MPAESAGRAVQRLERRMNVVLRNCRTDDLPQDVRRTLQKIKQAMNEIKLDIRDYEYAEQRSEQERWAKICGHNLMVLNTLMLQLDSVFSPADIAEFGANIETIRGQLV